MLSRASLFIILLILIYIQPSSSACPDSALTDASRGRYILDENTPVGHELFRITSDKQITIKPLLGAPSILKVQLNSTDIYSIVVSTTLDRENGLPEDITYELACLESTSATLTYSFPVTINDVNEFPPEFSKTSYSVNISEATEVNSDIFSLNGIAEDKDASPYDIIYTLQGASNLFSIQNRKIILDKTVDYDSGIHQYEVGITATETLPDDQVPKSSQVNLTVYIEDTDDQSPKFTSTIYKLNISEGDYSGDQQRTFNTSPPIYAEDEDSFKTSIGYNITSGDTDVFSIQPNGEIKISGILSRNQNNPSVVLGIKAYQIDRSGDRVDNAAVIVTVQDANDHAPVMSNTTYSVSVDEGLHSDVIILEVSATDSDLGTNAVFQFNVEGTELFEITTLEDVGSIRLRREKTIDREVVDQHSFLVYAKEIETGDKRESNRSTVTITVNDVNDNRPIFYIPSQGQSLEFHVNKTAEIDKLVGSVYANDSDAGNNGKVSYQLLQVRPDFRMNSSTGEIFVQSPLINKTGVINFEIIAADQPDDRSKIRQTIISGKIYVNDVNIGPPILLNLDSTMSVSEDIPKDFTIFTVQAADPDLSDSSNLMFAIINREPIFRIDPKSGVIKVNGTLDRETKDFYSLRIMVSDGQKTAQGFLNISILDVNDEKPVFNKSWYRFEVEEGLQPGELADYIVATDRDNGQNAELTYSILTAGGAELPISINNQSGFLSTTRVLDRETRDSYDFYVMAMDGGTPARSTAVSVTINVLDINDNSPVFETSNISLSYPEDSYPGCFYTAKAFDADEGANNETIYRTDSNQDIIEVHGNGSICVKNNQSLPLGNIHINIIANNTVPFQNCPECRDAVLSLVINVMDINNHSPIFDQPFYNFSLNEGQTHNANMRVHAQDNDTTAIYQNVLYEIVPSSAGVFSIDSVTGLIQFENPPDYEKQKIYNLQVGAKDTGSSRVKSIVNVTIYINDINDNNPYFIQDNYQCTVNENRTGDINGCIVLAKDNDTGLNAEIEYTLLNSGRFLVDVSNGLLSVNQTIDYEDGPKQYTVTVQASDKGDPTRSGYTSVIISVNNTNDNQPSFLGVPYNFSLYEIEATGSLVGIISANDADQDPINYELKSYNTDFRITERGSIYTKTSLDLDTSDSPDLYILNIEVTDGKFISPVNATVRVLPVNEYAPVFRGTFFGNILENATQGTIITTVQAEDKDVGRDGDVEYSLQSNSDKFHINNNTGVLSLDCNNCLDYNNQSSYNILVKAADSSPAPRMSFTTVVVLVNNVNDKPPVFSSPLYLKSIIENMPTGKTILNVIAADADTPDNQLQYSIDNSTYFTMNASSLVISQPIDGDKLPKPFIVLTVTVSDGQLSSTCVVNVTILDQNEHPPQIQDQNSLLPINASLQLSLPENVTVGHPVTTIHAFDQDFSNNGFTFWLTNEDNKFNINVTTGEITVRNRLDRSIKDLHNITVHISDHGTPPLFSEDHVYINVLDSNTAPVFDNITYSFSVSEEVPLGHLVGRVHATDKDFGSSGEVEYSIVSGNTGNSFTINPLNGSITNAIELNYEQEPRFTLTIKASDKSSIVKTSTVEVIISVSNVLEAPRWPSTLPSITIIKSKECQASQITAVPSDASSSDSDAVVVYNLLNYNNEFAINNETGRLQYQSNIVSGTYNLTLQACNSQELTLCSNATLQVIVSEKDRLIFCPAYLDLYIKEDFGVNKTVTVMNSTSDSQSTQYTIIRGNDDHVFILDSQSAELKLNKTLDREVTKEYILLIQAVDSSRPTSPAKSATAQILLHVTDIPDFPPYFSRLRYEGEISEGAAIGNPVISLGGPISIIAIDRDTNPQLIYSIEPASEYFEIQQTGLTASVILKSPVDRENTSVVDITVNVTDGYFYNTTTVHITITDINDVYPVLTKHLYNINVREDFAANSVLFTVTATDKDISDLGKLQYSLQNNQNNDGIFSIDHVLGDIRLYSLLDYENPMMRYLHFTVVVTDDVGHNDSAEVWISVLDVNDNPPRFSSDIYKFTFLEGIDSKMKNFNVSAMDMDSDNNSMLSYSITDGVDNFYINTVANKGVVTIVKKLDRETPGILLIDGVAVYKLNIEAVDHGDPQMTGSCVVNVNVEDINDNRPQFDTTELKYFGKVEEESAYGTKIDLVPELHITDKDYGLNGVAGIVYSLYPTTVPFIINSTTGEIVVDVSNYTLDRETITHYDIQITIEDHEGHEGLKNSKNVSITVLDKNDESPQFEKLVYEFTVLEDAAPSFSVGLVSAFDKDNGGNSSVRYYLEVNGDGRFFIDGTTGTVRVAGGLDREIIDKYQLKVVAEDDSRLTGTAIVNIIIEDANDNPPLFDHSVYNLTVAENSADVVVGTVHASDRDVGINSGFNYSVDSNSLFSIDQNGSLTLLYEFDRENISSYMFSVMATDHGNPPLSSIAQVLVTITDLNDNSPVFCLENICENQNYTTKMVNGLPPNAFVWMAVAKDIDDGTNSLITYDILGNASSLFDIGAKTGLITTKGFDLNTLVERGYLLSNESRKIVLEILAVDGGGRNTSVYLELTLEVITIPTPKFNQTIYNFTILENKPSDTEIGRVEAQIQNVTNVQFTYSILDGSEADSRQIYVETESNTGVIKSRRKLDREEIDRYLFVIEVQDNRTPPQTAFTQVYITVEDENDNTPEFDQTSYMTSVKENMLYPSLIRVFARDTDKGQNSIISYSILAGNNNDVFKIDEDTGQIDVIKLIDRENETHYDLIVMAKDNGNSPRNSSVNISIDIEDENDHHPRILNNDTVIYVRETNVQVTQIVQLMATDLDEGLNKEILFAIKEGDVNMFQINPINGWLSTMRALLISDKSLYQLTLMAYDLGTPPLNSTIDITIHVINSSTPRFPQRTYSVDIYIGMTVGDMIPVDVAAGSGHYAYTITGGNDIFHINTSTGIISLNKPVNDIQTYSMVVEARDLADEENKDTANVIVSVRKPEVTFAKPEYTAQIQEETQGEQFVIDLNTTLEFSALDILYTIVGDEPNFMISADNGSIYTTDKLDREVKSEYVLVVRATTVVNNGRTKRDANPDTTRVNISIIDINDNPPYFTYPYSTMEISIPQSAKQNHLLTKLDSHDPDEDSITEYKITGGDSNIFSINKNTGDIRSLVDMSDTDKDYFSLVVQAVDTESPLSSNITLQVYVVPDENRFILTGNITLPVFINFRDTFLSNLSKILNMTIELDNVQPHSSIVDGKKVIDSDRTDVYIKAYDENKKLIPWQDLQRAVLSQRKAIDDLFKQGMLYVTEKPARIITNSDGTLGVAEMTLLGLACAIFIGSLISIVIVIRSWKIQAAKENNIKLALIARKKLSRDTTFSDTFCDSDSAVMELDADVDDDSKVFNAEKYVKSKRETEKDKEIRNRLSLKLYEDINIMDSVSSVTSEAVPEVEFTILEEQEKVLEFGNETADSDSLALRDIVLSQTVMEIEKEIILNKSSRGLSSSVANNSSISDVTATSPKLVINVENSGDTRQSTVAYENQNVESREETGQSSVAYEIQNVESRREIRQSSVAYENQNVKSIGETRQSSFAYENQAFDTTDTISPSDKQESSLYADIINRTNSVTTDPKNLHCNDEPTIKSDDGPSVTSDDRPTITSDDRPTITSDDRPTIKSDDRPTIKSDDQGNHLDNKKLDKQEDDLYTTIDDLRTDQTFDSSESTDF